MFSWLTTVCGVQLMIHAQAYTSKIFAPNVGREILEK